jgi:hypothetical protein
MFNLIPGLHRVTRNPDFFSTRNRPDILTQPGATLPHTPLLGIEVSNKYNIYYNRNTIEVELKNWSLIVRRRVLGLTIDWLFVVYQWAYYMTITPHNNHHLDSKFKNVYVNIIYFI